MSFRISNLWQPYFKRLSVATPIDPFLHSKSDVEVMGVIVRWFIEQEVIVISFH